MRFAWLDSGYSSCVSLRWLLVQFSHIFNMTVDSRRLLLEDVSYSAMLGSSVDTLFAAVH